MTTSLINGGWDWGKGKDDVDNSNRSPTGIFRVYWGGGPGYVPSLQPQVLAYEFGSLGQKLALAGFRTGLTPTLQAGGNLMNPTMKLKNDIRLADLQQEGILLTDGHFDYGNGYHGGSYLTAHPKMHDPALVMACAQRLAKKLGSGIRNQVQIVVGPITGGALLAFSLAVAIDSAREFGPHGKVLFAPIYKSGGQLIMRKHYQQIIAGEFGQPGKKVIVADDVCNTGLTIRRSRQLVESYGGEVLCSAVLYDRQSAIVELKNHFSLDQVNFDPELVRAEECLQCRLHVPITQF